MVNASSISCDFDSNILRLLIKPSLSAPPCSSALFTPHFCCTISPHVYPLLLSSSLLFIFSLHPVLSLFPSVHLSRQVARTARPGSVTRSAMTEGKRGSTTGTFPELLPIRGAGHALQTHRMWTQPPFPSKHARTHAHTNAVRTAESFMELELILNKRSRIQQRAQDPQTVCAWGMRRQCAFVC